MSQHRRFDDIHMSDLREAGSLKWTTHPDAIGAFVAEMDFGIAPAITEALHAAVDAGQFGYLPTAAADRLGDAYTDWAAREYGWNIPARNVRPIADVIKGLELAVDHFSAPGSPVILPTPAYMPFLTVPPALGREIIEVPMARDGERYVYDLDALDAAFRAGGDLLVLCNPHNPVGRVLERDELTGICEVVERNGGRVFADEIHAPLVYGGHRHVPYASVSEASAGHTVTAASASKAWDLPGLKCAQMILSNDADLARWSDIAMMAEHGAANLGVVANTAAYRAGRPWLDEVVDYLDGSRALLGDLVAELLPGVGYTPPEGTYLAWLDVRRLGLGDEPAAFFLEHAGVALTDGRLCGRAGTGFVRYTLATPRPIMVRTVELMAKAVTDNA